MAYLDIQHIKLYRSNLKSRSFTGKDHFPVLDDINLKIEKGEIFGIMGPSGCGKTVLLKTIAGLFVPAEGEIFIGGVPVTKNLPAARSVSMVFQDFTLYSHMTNLNNLLFPLINKSGRKKPINTEAVSRLLHIEEKKLLSRFPRYTSLGEKQRVSIGKALMSSAEILLLDEPLSNVEDSLRTEIRHSLKTFIRENSISTLYVSHNQTEIGEISDNIAVMRMGKIEQSGSYLDLYRNPQTLFVAISIGEKPANLLTSGEVSTLTDGMINYTLTIRPDECMLTQKEPSITVSGNVSFIENFIQEGKKIIFINKEGELFGVEVDIDCPVSEDDKIKIYIPFSRARFFDESKNLVSPLRV